MVRPELIPTSALRVLPRALALSAIASSAVLATAAAGAHAAAPVPRAVCVVPGARPVAVFDVRVSGRRTPAPRVDRVAGGRIVGPRPRSFAPGRTAAALRVRFIRRTVTWQLGARRARLARTGVRCRNATPVRAPQLAGTPTPGGTLTARAGRWSHALSAFVFQWQWRSAAGWASLGANAPALRIPALAAGAQIRVLVRARGYRGWSAPAPSRAVRVAQAPITLPPGRPPTAQPPAKPSKPSLPVAGARLWAADYDDISSSDSLLQTWYREQEPHAPGPDGPLATDRIRVSAAPGAASDPQRPAGKVMRVELRPFQSAPGLEDGDVNVQGSSTYNRAEVYGRYPTTPATSLPADRWPDPVGSERWYGFSVYVDPSFVGDDSKWLDITQWKGFYGGSPPLAIEIEGGQFELGGSILRRPLGAIQRGRWTRFVVGVHWSADTAGGWVQVFRDGAERLPRTTTRTMDTYTSNGVTRPDPIYLKQGIYRSKAWAVTHVLYFGPTEVGLARSAVS